MAHGKDERVHMKYAGAMLVIFGCGGFGFSMAAAYRHEEKVLRQLRNILQFLYCELQFRMTTLPELCLLAGRQNSGTLSKVFLRLGKELERQLQPDAASCMVSAMEGMELTPRLRELLEHFGQTLGCFDLKGQLLGIEELRAQCIATLEEFASGREDRLRSYQTLGLCAGAALVILFV